MNLPEKNIFGFVKKYQWEKVATREVSLFELVCAAKAYLNFPFENKLDSLVVVKSEIATRYCIPEQLKQLERDTNGSSLKEVMENCIKSDEEFNAFLKKDPFKDVSEFVRQYTKSWLGELLGFYIGLYSKDQDVLNLSDQLRGIHNAQHEVIDKYLPEFLNSLAIDFSVNSDLVKFLTPEEIITKQFDIEEIKKRSDYYSLITINGEIEILTGSKIKKAIEEILLEEENDDSVELKGKVAFPGKISGTVRIVNTLREIEKVLEGDILVSIMTRTNLLPAIKKAAAFVTDEGGITCHAAIIAREMKKPCVIGTKFATRVLKDGDRVEVDAEKGIIKKL